MSGFWIGSITLILLATGFLLLPLYRASRRYGTGFVSGPMLALPIIPAAVILYLGVTSYDPDAPQSVVSSEELALVEQLAARLQANPDNVEGWRLLGRSYRELEDYSRARMAFEQAWQRTAQPDNTLKLNYAETMLATDPTAALGMAGDLIDEVLADSPSDQAALWLGGIIALDTGRTALAVERFGRLLATDPPPEIADILRRQIMALTDAGEAELLAGDSGPELDIEVSVAETISLEPFGPNSRLYILARSADSPMPIAVTQNELSSLPGTFTLNDGNSMAGRTLGQFERVTVIARISASGSATASPGDVYDEVTVAVDSDEPIRLVIDKVVPEG